VGTLFEITRRQLAIVPIDVVVDIHPQEVGVFRTGLHVADELSVHILESDFSRWDGAGRKGIHLRSKFRQFLISRPIRT
jgi:hypothetical protein